MMVMVLHCFGGRGQCISAIVVVSDAGQVTPYVIPPCNTCH